MTLVAVLLLSVLAGLCLADAATTATTTASAATSEATSPSILCPLIEAAVIAKGTLDKNSTSACFSTQHTCQECAVDAKCAYCPSPVVFVSGRLNGVDVSVTCDASIAKNGWCWNGSFFTFLSPISSINIDAKNSLDVVVYCQGLPNYGQCSISGTALVALSGSAIALVTCCFFGVFCFCVCRSRRSRGQYQRV